MKDPEPKWVAIEVKCRKCGKTKTYKWPMRANFWPECCDQQMTQTRFATAVEPQAERTDNGPV